MKLAKLANLEANYGNDNVLCKVFNLIRKALDVQHVSQ